MKETKITLRMRDAGETIRHLIEDGEEIRIEAFQSRTESADLSVGRVSRVVTDHLILTNNTHQWAPNGAWGLCNTDKKPTCIPVRDWFNHRLSKIRPNTVVHIYKRQLQTA